MKSYSVYLDSGHLACKPNKVLTSKVLRYLNANRHELVDDPRQADFLVLSTCGFTQMAEDQCVDFFKEQLGRVSKDTKMISIGCLSRINPDTYKKELGSRVTVLEKESDLDEYFKTAVAYDDLKGEYIDEEILRRLNRELYNANAGFFHRIQNLFKKVDPLVKKSPYLTKVLDELLQRNKFFVQIATGCVGNCAYCIIKKAKGNVVSRPVGEIMEDIHKAYIPGTALYLVGDDCGSYGADSGSSLPELLGKIHKEFPELTIEINYLNPLWLSKQKQEYLDVFREMKIGATNISLESGSNRIIRMMNRRYDVNELKDTLREIRRISPDTLVWAHMMVGFPGETVSDYIRTVAALPLFGFAHILAYSNRRGTKSSLMTDQNHPIMISIKQKSIRFYSYLLVLARTIKGFFEESVPISVPRNIER